MSKDNAIDNYLAINFYGAASSRKMSVENIKKHVHYIQQHVPGRAIVLLSYPEKYSELSLLSQEFSHEPPRDCRRLIFLREYDNENTKLYP